jgi:hypothetical protein
MMISEYEQHGLTTRYRRQQRCSNE